MSAGLRWLGYLSGVALLVACPAGDDGGQAEESTGDTSTSTTSAEESVDESSTTGPMVCLGTGNGSTQIGDACTDNGDCDSGVCTIFTDVPINADAVCAETPPSCNTRITGTVFDFTTKEPLGNVAFKVAKALEAVADPVNANAILEVMTGADGRVDATTAMPVNASLAIISLVGGDDTYFLTATGISAAVDDGSEYEVGVGNHDYWAIPNADLETWSDSLANDGAIPATNLPLGERGGVVGLVRQRNTATPVADVTVLSTEGDTNTQVRYLDEDGTFQPDATSPTGIFVIFNASQQGEDFDALDTEGDRLGGGLAGSTPGAVFTLIIDVDA